jgi:hypothetical protein
MKRTTSADAIVGSVGNHFIYYVSGLCCLQQCYVEACITVVALFQRSVIAGKLELVAPLELQGDAFQRLRCS